MTCDKPFFVESEANREGLKRGGAATMEYARCVLPVMHKVDHTGPHGEKPMAMPESAGEIEYREFDLDAPDAYAQIKAWAGDTLTDEQIRGAIAGQVLRGVRLARWKTLPAATWRQR